MQICHASTSFLVVLCWDEIERIVDIKEKVQQCFEPTQRFELLLFTKSKRPKDNAYIPSRVSIVSSYDFTILGTIKFKRRIAIQQDHFEVGMIISSLTKRQEKLIRSISMKHTVGFDYDKSFIDINLVSQKKDISDKILFAKNMLSKITIPKLRLNKKQKKRKEKSF